MIQSYYDKSIFQKMGDIKSPAIIYDYQHICSTIHLWKSELELLFPKHELLFAMKANHNPYILNVLKNQKIGIDVSSESEYRLAKSIGFKFVSIHGLDFSPSFIEKVLKSHEIIDIDSLYQYNLIRSCANMLHIKVFNIGVRVTEDTRYFDFGLTMDEIKSILKEGFANIVRIHFHGDVSKDRMNHRMNQLRKMMLEIPTIETVNFGGGFARIEDVISFFKPTLRRYQDILQNLVVVFEPGDALLKKSGFLVSSVLSTKIRKNKNIAFLNFSPWVSGPWINSIPIVANNPNPIGKQYEWTLRGNSMFEADYFIHRSYILPSLNEGSQLIFPECGTYVSVNFRAFQLFPKLKEYLYIQQRMINITGGYDGQDCYI